MSVLVDTSALHALLVRTETGHREVESALDELLEQGRSLLTTSYVLVETVALLQHRFGLAAVSDFNKRIRPLLDVVWIDARLHDRAMERLVRADRRGLSLVDVASFVVMDEEGLRTALALDADFAREGFDVLPRL